MSIVHYNIKQEILKPITVQKAIPYSYLEILYTVTLIDSLLILNTEQVCGQVSKILSG